MPTRAHTDHPFSRPHTPGKAQLQAYVEGRLTPEQAQAVERSMELDPLIREAVEGLRTPGALAAMASLNNHRPSTFGSAGRGRLFLLGSIAGMLFLGGTWIVVSALMENKERVETVAGIPAITQGDPVSEAMPPVLNNAEIAAAVEQPETLRIGHRAEKRPMPSVRTITAIERDAGITPLDPIRAPLPDAVPDPARPARAKRSTRMLLFPHDLKLVHPDELYPFEPGVDPAALNVSAQYADRRTQQANSAPQRTLRYTDYMGTTLGQFSRNDHKACLKSLNFLMEQYPDDVNALFYAGLCSYNLALYEHARTFLRRAATHPIDSFNEEAVWYHAQTLERLGEKQAAQEAFARIVADGGFYAEPAALRLR